MYWFLIFNDNINVKNHFVTCREGHGNASEKLHLRKYCKDKLNQVE